MKVAFVYFNYNIPYLDVGLSQTMTVAQKGGHKVYLIDPTFNVGSKNKFILNQIKSIRPKVICYSGSNFTFYDSIKVAKEVKALNNKIIQIWGGPFTTLAPELVIQHEEVNAILRGEVEMNFISYLDNINNETKLKNIDGLWFKDNNNKIIINGSIPFLHDLNEAPIANHDFWDIKKYMKYGFISKGEILHYTSKGCPFACTFCSYAALNKLANGKHHRLRDPKLVIDEINQNYEKYHKFGFKIILFVDPVFGLNKEHFYQFTEQYIKAGLDKKLPYFCQTRPDIMDKKFTRQLAKSGCCYVSIGLESGNDYVRIEIYKKRIAKQQFIKAVNLMRKYNIMYRINYIYDGPGETWRTLRKGLKFAESLKPTEIHLNKYWPLVGTNVFSEMEQKGLIQHDKSKLPSVNQARPNLENYIVNLYYILYKGKLLMKRLIKAFSMKKVSLVTDIMRSLFDFDNTMISIKYPIYFIQYHFWIITYFKYRFDYWTDNGKPL